jgi:hypothetical protein
MSDTAVAGELRQFTSRLLETCGGVVDWNSRTAGEAVVPPEVARILGTAEYFRLSTEPVGTGLFVSLATDFLDHAAGVLKATVPQIGSFRIAERYLKGGDLQAAALRCYTWLNARVKFTAAHPIPVEYHTWWLLASLNSEDRWESRFSVSINAASLASVELPDLFDEADIAPAHDAPSSERTYARAVDAARRHLQTAAREFTDRMDERLARDKKRINDYYKALLRETDKPRRRAAAPVDPEVQESKRRAVKLELARKLSELEERYTMQAGVEPLLLISTTIPALAIQFSVLRKRTEGTLTVYWNSVTKQFEPAACTACGRNTFSVAFTDDEAAPLCANCGG